MRVIRLLIDIRTQVFHCCVGMFMLHRTASKWFLSSGIDCTKFWGLCGDHWRNTLVARHSFEISTLSNRINRTVSVQYQMLKETTKQDKT